MIKDIVTKYRKGLGVKHPISYQRFADEVNVYLHPGHQRTWAHWRKIENGNYLPTYYEINYLVSHATGWVRDFAAELLAEME